MEISIGSETRKINAKFTWMRSNLRWVECTRFPFAMRRCGRFWNIPLAPWCTAPMLVSNSRWSCDCARELSACESAHHFPSWSALRSNAPWSSIVSMRRRQACRCHRHRCSNHSFLCDLPDSINVDPNRQVNCWYCSSWGWRHRPVCDHRRSNCCLRYCSPAPDDDAFDCERHEYLHIESMAANSWRHQLRLYHCPKDAKELLMADLDRTMESTVSQAFLKKIKMADD